MLKIKNLYKSFKEQVVQRFPTRKAILVGLAFPIPVLVEMNFLDNKSQPQSIDPRFWNMWLGNEEPKIEWQNLTEEWQNKK